MGVGHYENFPVASVLLPASLRPAVRAIYRFARTADDIADEGDAATETRLAQLQALDDELRALGPTSERWPDLAAAVAAHGLAIGPFRDLLSAFAQDVTTTRYQDWPTLLDYCRRSANPIGRLLLALYRRSEPRLLAMADAICTGLQLTNFWQDVALDWAKGRVYLPQEDLGRFGVSEEQIASQRADDAWRSLMAYEVDRTRTMLRSGEPLAAALGGRIGLELRLVVQGGLRILERIDSARGDVFRHRPRLTARDWTVMALRALRPLPATARLSASA
ncbi:MAG: squalene synthase HpnC [Burkholderiaceae bacterium]|nr:squalene synthase HpnC [Burkholderiaceae bacterium]